MTLDLAADLSGLELATAESVFDAGWAAGWRLPPPLRLSEWSDRYRIVPSSSSAEAGPWRTDRTPFLREILDCLSNDSTVRKVVLMKSTQVGGTEVILNWLGYVIDYHPGPMMVVQPTADSGREWTVQRVDPMVDASPALAGKVVSSRVRDGSTAKLKKFPGGFISVASAKSANDLRSKPIRDLALDEVDQYETDLDGQGSPIELAERRQSSFRRRKTLLVSSPTVADYSAIEAQHDAGDQRQYHVACPHCATPQTLVIEHLTDGGEYICGACGALIAEYHKAAMLAAGTWVPRHPGREVRSYHINALYAPQGLGYSWREVATLRTLAAGDPIREKLFTNTILGLPYAAATQRIEAEHLATRAEPYPRRHIPRGGLLLTIGIDVQVNRWAVLLCAWGRNEQCWIVDWVEVPGDPTRESDWDELDKVVFAPLANSAGLPMQPDRIAIDSGSFTDHVYRWVRRNAHRKVIAIKGSGEVAAPVIFRPTRKDANAKGKSQKSGVLLWHVGVNTTKTTLWGWLQHDEGRAPVDRHVHFPNDMPAEFWQHMTSEAFDISDRRWVRKPGVRNEAWDCWQYAYAATHHPHVRVYAMRDADWTAIEAKLQPPTADLFALAPTVAAYQRIDAAPSPAPTEAAAPPDTTSHHVAPPPAAPLPTTPPPTPPEAPRKPSWLGRRTGPWIGRR